MPSAKRQLLTAAPRIHPALQNQDSGHLVDHLPPTLDRHLGFPQETVGLSRAETLVPEVYRQRNALPQLLGLLSHSTVLLSPDSGPAHMATMVALPVIGLYAATNPARAGPYYSRQWCVDKYDAAAQKYLGRPAAQISWTTKIERPGVMDLIGVSDVTAKLDALMARCADGVC